MRFFAIASVLFTAALSVFASPVVERGNPPSCAVVLADLSNTVVPLANQLYYCNSENATQAILTPIITDITTAVTGAVTDLTNLVGYSLDVILLAVDGVTILTVEELASIVCDLVNLIFVAIHAVLIVVDSSIYSVIFALQALCSVITIVVSLVSTIVLDLVLLLAPVLFIVTDLGLFSLLNGILGGLL